MEKDGGEPMTHSPSEPTQPEGADQTLADLDRIVASLGTARAPTDSRVPLGRQAHRTVSRLVSRDIAVVGAELAGAAHALRDAVLAIDTRLSALDARLSALEAHAPGFVDPSVAARVVRALYLAILEREPDPEGLAYHSRRLAAGLPLERQVAEFAQARDGDRRHAPSGTGASDKEWARLRDLQLAQQRTLRAVTHRLALIEDRLLGAQQGGGAADPSQR
jgi:hypothetical protein